MGGGLIFPGTPVQEIPNRPNIEHLEGEAKKLLKSLRVVNPATQLAAAQFALAGKHGSSSWRSLRVPVLNALPAAVDRPEVEAVVAQRPHEQPCPRTALPIATEILDRHCGHYEVDPQLIVGGSDAVRPLHSFLLTLTRIRRGLLNGITSCLTMTGLLLMLSACADPTGRHLDAELMTAETSAIPGAQAKILPATSTSQPSGAGVNACVTQAGYCPLAEAKPSGLNCVCQSAGSAYGGETGAPPQTVKSLWNW